MHTTKKIRKAVLPAAGLGTRLLPATKALPKELLPIVDKPALQILVEEAVAAGVEEIIFVVNTGKEAIWNHFSPNLPLEESLRKAGKLELLESLTQLNHLAKFCFVIQSEPLGDGHAILQAKQLIGDEPFLVLFGDDLVFGQPTVAEQLVAVHARTGGAVVALTRVSRERVSSYGVVQPGLVRDRLVEITGFVEKPKPEQAPSELAIAGKYICPPEIFDILEKNPSGSGEIRLIDALSELVKTDPVTGWLFTGERFDTGDRLGFVQAVVAAAADHSEIGADFRQFLTEFVSRRQSR